MTEYTKENLPPGLSTMLREFTLSVIKENPVDLKDFAVEYFTRLRDGSTRRASKSSVELPTTIPEEASEVSYSRESERRASGGGKPLPVGPRYGRRASICAESYDPSKDTGQTLSVVHPKTPAQRERLLEAVSDILLFRDLDKDEKVKVVDAMFERRVTKGLHVIEQGEDGDNFYVIETGKFEARVAKNGKSQTVCQFDGKGYFGELALMYNQPRAATIVSLSDGVLWAMDRVSFKHIVLQSAFRKRSIYEQLLENVPMLKHLDAYERMKVADALQSQEFSPGQRIIREGDVAGGMYFLEEGEVRVTINKNGKELEVKRINKGSYFGEKALVDHSPRTANVYAVGRVKAPFLEIESFERLLGPCMDIMKRNMKSYKKSS